MKKIFTLFAVVALAMTAKAQAPALMSANYDSETKVVTVELDNGATTISSFKFIFRLPDGVSVDVKKVFDEEEEDYVDVTQILKVTKRIPTSLGKTFSVMATSGEKAGATQVVCYGGSAVKNRDDSKAIVTIGLAGDEIKGNVQFTEAQVVMDGVETNLADFICPLSGTGIEGISADETKSGVIYNMAGQRVSKATKGIYVVDGKKVAVK